MWGDLGEEVGVWSAIQDTSAAAGSAALDTSPQGCFGGSCFATDGSASPCRWKWTLWQRSREISNVTL